MYAPPRLEQGRAFLVAPREGFRFLSGWGVCACLSTPEAGVSQGRPAVGGKCWLLFLSDLGVLRGAPPAQGHVHGHLGPHP